MKKNLAYIKKTLTYVKKTLAYIKKSYAYVKKRGNYNDFFLFFRLKNLPKLLFVRIFKFVKGRIRLLRYKRVDKPVVVLQ